MGRYTTTGDDLKSTREAAEAAGISYITLRRWLAEGAFQNWLHEEGKPPLKSLELSNGKHVWQFGNRNRADLCAYRDLPERRQRGASGRPRDEVRQERNRKRAFKRMTRTKISPAERQRNAAFRRYTKALVELRNLGFFPHDARLNQVSRKHISESEVMHEITRDYHAIEHRRLAEALGKVFAPRPL